MIVALHLAPLWKQALEQGAQTPWGNDNSAALSTLMAFGLLAPPARFWLASIRLEGGGTRPLSALFDRARYPTDADAIKFLSALADRPVTYFAWAPLGGAEAAIEEGDA